MTTEPNKTNADIVTATPPPSAITAQRLPSWAFAPVLVLLLYVLLRVTLEYHEMVQILDAIPGMAFT